MNMEIDELLVNGKVYVEKGTEQKPAQKIDGMEYCIIRTYSAGVFAGYIDRKIKGKIRTIYKSRRIWRWYGAASLSELAIQGTNKPDSCKFAILVPELDLTEVIEVIPCSEKAEASIKGVKVWEV